ncbi:MAG: GDP-mannose 4,6-dehydratase [Candidatus Omnitrophica bacterium]|jgi:dTDP-glucose 4,6-dehydratase|nr:GDP-mannose 4,6-dehydratase [Candidatus Omnitrophota bacterium]
MKVVYITGCLGFIGSYVTKKCLELGWWVKGVDKITYAANKDLLIEFAKYPNFSFVQCDINDLKFLYDCDFVINLAAETHVGNSISSSDEFIKSNINGVHNLLELIKNHRGENVCKPTLIQISTDETYGDISVGAHVETDLLKPSNPYSSTKAAADMLVMAWGRTHNVPYIIVRPTNNYGIGQYVEKLIPKAIKCLNLERKIPLHNNGLPIRNWLHAEDTANAIITIIEKGIVGEIYNIAGGFEQKNIDTVIKIIKCYNSEIKYDFNTLNYIDFSCNRRGQDVRYALDDSKLRSLGWKPTKLFDEEITKIVDYYKNKFIW